MLTNKSLKALLNWEEKYGRTTPWRRLNEPYKLGVAEVLLQKTKAADVVSVWAELTTAYKTPNALSTAPAKQLLPIIRKLGLGNQRVSRLKSMANSILTGDKKISGLGPYGSAVLALAQGVKAETVPVDGNIARVVCRYLSLSFTQGEPRKKKQVQQAVTSLLSACRGARRKLTLVYALVDLGDSVCKPHKPTCETCPISQSCATAIMELRSP